MGKKIDLLVIALCVGLLAWIIGLKMGTSIGHDSVCEQIKYENKWNVEEVRYCTEWDDGVDKVGTK